MPVLLMTIELNGVVFQRRSCDGFFHYESICETSGKRFCDYLRNTETQTFLHALAAQMETRIKGPSGLIREKFWIHPRVAEDLARWITPALAVQLRAELATADLPPLDGDCWSEYGPFMREGLALLYWLEAADQRGVRLYQSDIRAGLYILGEMLRDADKVSSGGRSYP